MHPESINKFIVILAEGLYPYEEGDLLGNRGGRLRMTAAAHLQKDDPESFIVASGGTASRPGMEGKPHVSESLEVELISLGIPTEKIIKESNSLSTFQQLIEIQKIMENRKPKEVIFVTNIYHVDRVRWMIKLAPRLGALRKKHKTLVKSAESILLDKDPEKWKKVISGLYERPDIKKIIESELQGIKDIKSGTYKFR